MQKILSHLIQATKLQIESLNSGRMTYLPVANMKKNHPLTLERLREKVTHCTLCELHKARIQTVFGEGDPKAKLMFIGEGPGAEENLQGKPFVGMAGQLLTKIIEAIQLRRDQVYITNIVKCRPPGNRMPLPMEIASCRPYLLSQIQLIHPKIICALGKTAAWALLNTEVPISQLRGKWFEACGIKVIPTFHPAYLLRNPQDKRLVWEDMKKIRRALDE